MKFQPSDVRLSSKRASVRVLNTACAEADLRGLEGCTAFLGRMQRPLLIPRERARRSVFFRELLGYALPRRDVAACHHVGRVALNCSNLHHDVEKIVNLGNHVAIPRVGRYI